MESSAFKNSSIEGSIVNSDAYTTGPQSVMANNSPIQHLIINNYGPGDIQSGRPNLNTEYILNDVQQTQTRVSFADQETMRNLDEPSFKIPDSISRLPNRNECAQVPKPARPNSIKRYATSGRPPTQFHVILESRLTMQGKLKPRLQSSVIRRYMQSDFFCSDNAIPLWEPSPAYNLRSKNSNVCVGDVGIFTRDGGFHVLFNTFLSRTENVELGFTPPDDFEPYSESVQFSEQVSKITPMSFTKYVSVEGDFKSDPEIPGHPDHPKRKYIRAYDLVRKHSKNPKGVRSGTLLDLPNGVWKDRMHPTMVLAMHEYFDLHAESWYNYCTGQVSDPIPAGHLNFISTSYKCNAWALAIGVTRSPDKTYARLSASPKSKILYGWDTHDEIVGWTGPLSEGRGADGLPLTNQCVAVEVYSIEKTNGIQKVGVSLSRFMSRMSIRSRTSTVKSRTRS